MEKLTEPLIKEDTEAPVILREKSETGSNERDSSFIDFQRANRTASVPVSKQDVLGGKRRHLSVPPSDPRNSIGSRNQSVVVSGDDRFILEESESPSSSEKDGTDEQTSGAYINVHYIRGNTSGDISTSLALEACRKTVLRPYYIFMKMVGWRRFSDKKSDLVQPWNRRILNIAYPFGFFILLMISSITQILTCFGRGESYNIRHDINDQCYFLYASCRNLIVTSLAAPSIVVLIAYAFGLYVFRFVNPENLATLTEKVFLGFTASHGAFSQKRLIYSLRVIMIIGMLWQLYAVGLNMTRMFSLELFDRDTYIDVTSQYEESQLVEMYNNGNCSDLPDAENGVLRYLTVILSAVGLVLTDFFYLAAVIHYALECQLIIFLMRATADRIRSQCWDVDLAIKEIKISQDFLDVLNGRLAHMVSLLLFVFAGLWLEGARSLYNLDSRHQFPVIVTSLNIIQWSIVIAIPIVQGVRLTIAGDELETLGQELRTRPFVYRDVPQLDLDSLVMYTSNLNMNAKLINVPLHTCLVLPALFIGVILWRQFTVGQELALGRWF